MAGPVGELELVPLAFLDVLDVGEQEARPLGGVGDHRVAQAHPLVAAVPAGESQLCPAALGAGAPQQLQVVGVDQVDEALLAQGGPGPAEQPAERVVDAGELAAAVAVQFGDGHAAGGVLEGLPEGLLAGPQRLLLLLQAGQGALHLGAQPGVADGDGGLQGEHLQGFAGPRAGALAAARAVHREDAEQVAAGAVHRGEQDVGGVPVVVVDGQRAVAGPGRDVGADGPAAVVREEAQGAPVVGDLEHPVPGLAGSDLAEQDGGAAEGGLLDLPDGGDHQVAVGADQADRGGVESEPVDRALDDRLQGSRQAPGSVEVRHDPVQGAEGREADVGLRLGFHAGAPRLLRIVLERLSSDCQKN